MKRKICLNTRGCYNKSPRDGSNFCSNECRLIYEGRIEPPIPTKETSPPKSSIQDNTDKYIQLLRDGVIDKADFLKLISTNKTETNDYIY